MRIKDFQVEGVVPVTVEKGQRVRVKVKRIIPDTKTVILEAVDMEEK